MTNDQGNRATANDVNAEYVRERLGIVDCQILIRVERTVISPQGDVLSCESRYFITSLDPDSVTPG